jgi:hypothetical protein
LLDFLLQVSAQIQAEYERIRRRAVEDPGTAGDQGEENWASVLRGWLPSVVPRCHKGEIDRSGRLYQSQVDVIVLKPAYPSALADKKLYMAAGVAAAFECKTTLKRRDVEDSVRTAAKVKALLSPRVGTQHQETHTPLVYGLLAHSHVWKSPESKPHEIIRGALNLTDALVCEHPRLQIDLICVADLTVWTQDTTPFVGPATWGARWETMAPIMGPDGGIITSFVEHNEPPAMSGKFNPIGLCIMDITRRLGWEDRSCRDLANYYRSVLSFSGFGTQRHWPNSIFSHSTMQRLASPLSSVHLLTAEFWDDQSNGLIG